MYIGEQELDVINAGLNKYGPKFIYNLVMNQEEAKALYTLSGICVGLTKETRDSICKSIEGFASSNGLTTGKTFGG